MVWGGYRYSQHSISNSYVKVDQLVYALNVFIWHLTKEGTGRGKNTDITHTYIFRQNILPVKDFSLIYLSLPCCLPFYVLSLDEYIKFLCNFVILNLMFSYIEQNQLHILGLYMRRERTGMLQITIAILATSQKRR